MNSKKNIKLLLVDDEKQFTTLMHQALSRLGYKNIRVANSGTEALKLIEEMPVNILITDIKIPDIGGLELTQKTLQLYPDTIIIAITGYADIDTSVEIMKCGASDFLKKPIGVAEMHFTIESAAEHWHLRHALRLANEELRKKNTELSQEVTDRKLAENALKTSRLELESVFQNIPEGIISINADFRVIRRNNPLENICPLAHRMTQGILLNTDLLPCMGECFNIISHTLKTGQPVREYHVECNYENHQSVKTVKNLVLTSAPLISEKNEFEGAMLVIRDITLLAELENKLRERESFRNIVGKSEKMQHVYMLIKQLADLETTVLITGESGTGKELVMEALHYEGIWASGPIIRVNCSALSESLLESELFGHVRGSFTDAVKDRTGRFESARGGTLFLDEIGDLPLHIQLKLLRVLERKEFERVGDSKTHKINARIVTATHVDLEERIRQGRFREDFYYRLKVMNIHIPPLRERKEDIPLLVNHFCSVFGKTFNKHFTGVTDNVLEIFMKYPWNGNVRELKHTIEHACILCPGGEISKKYLTAELTAYEMLYQTSSLPSVLKQEKLTREQILASLNKTDWNKAKAARLLGVGRTTLYRKLAELGITKK